MNNLKRILGVQSGISKKGNFYAMITYATANTRDGGIGEVADVIFLDSEEEVKQLLASKPVGKNFDCVYGEKFGKPAVIGIKLL